MSLQVLIQDMKAIEQKSGRAIRFNLVVGVDDGNNCLQEYIVLPGFRCMDGNIYPSMNRVKGMWYNNVFCNQTLAEQIYIAVERELTRLNPNPPYVLNKMATAISPIFDKLKMARYIPEMHGAI